MLGLRDIALQYLQINEARHRVRRARHLKKWGGGGGGGAGIIKRYFANEIIPLKMLLVWIILD